MVGLILFYNTMAIGLGMNMKMQQKTNKEALMPTIIMAACGHCHTIDWP